MWARILSARSAKRRGYRIARTHAQGNSTHGMTDPNQSSSRKVDLNRLVPAVGECSQPREDRVGGSGIIIPCDFTQELVSVFGDLQTSRRVNHSHMRS